MSLQHAEEGRDVARHVVDDLDLWRRSPPQQDDAHADRGLGKAVVLDRFDQRD